MKKSLLILGVAFMAITFSSCEKEYTCECTVWGLTQSDTQEMKKSDAEDWCAKSNTDAATWGGSCELK